MARIAGVDLPRDKKIEYALTYIFGIGLTSAKKIVAEAQIDPTTRVRDLAETEISKLRSVIENNYNVEGDLRRELAMSIRRLIEIGSYRGMRHRRGLPCRGQRTKTNARMRKGPKRTVSAKRKK
ncbi:MAG: 30S ribosomal protein S13 [Abditibacteriota bacterium]|nr:30S ribosomal protein S13 [Abditibacteriota bacterium]MBP5093727.1 30S ribosomal protein S13 [Abditibacteriota bacterium]MBP5737907.1 30S ribosomal protein S13 [Abditibacteriota bacterium]